MAATEKALLRLCARANERLLQEAFDFDGDAETQEHTHLGRASTVTGRADVKKASEAIAQWESLPLSTSEDLKQWAEVMSQQPRNSVIPSSDRGYGKHAPALARQEVSSPDREEVAGGSQNVHSTPQESLNQQAPIMATAASHAADDLLDIPQDFQRQYLW